MYNETLIMTDGSLTVILSYKKTSSKAGFYYLKQPQVITHRMGEL